MRKVLRISITHAPRDEAPEDRLVPPEEMPVGFGADGKLTQGEDVVQAVIFYVPGAGGTDYSINLQPGWTAEVKQLGDTEPSEFAGPDTIGLSLHSTGRVMFDHTNMRLSFQFIAPPPPSR